MRLLSPKFPENKNGKGGYGIYFSRNDRLYHALDIQIIAKRSSELPTPKNFKKKQKNDYKYFQNYELSVYVKPPSSVVYKTHKLTLHIPKTGTLSIKIPTSLKECLFQPYISWHGGKEVYDEKGLISMKGFDFKGKNSQVFNQKPTMGKGDLAGRYYMFANVVFPVDLAGLPAVNRKRISNLEIIESYEDNFTDSKRVVGHKNLLIDAGDNFKGGICLYLFIHGLGLFHANRFGEHEKSLWKTKPITLNPTLEAPLGVSLVFMDDGGVVEKKVSDAIYIANSTKSNTDMSFSIRRTAFVENLLIQLLRLKVRIFK